MAKTFDELFDEAYELVQRANGLQAERIRIRQKALTLRADLQSDIDDLKDKADRLAAEFKRLYQDSQGAYSSGQGALAKSLASEGKAKQIECEELNCQVKRGIEELKRKVADLYRQADEKQAEADSLIRRARAIEKELKTRGTFAWSSFVSKKIKGGYQTNLYVGMKGNEQHLDEFYSMDERDIHRGTVRTDEKTKRHGPPE